MIIEKVYKIRYDAAKDVDEIIEILAEDIKNGFTTRSIVYCGDTMMTGTIRTDPNYEITVVKKWIGAH